MLLDLNTKKAVIRLYVTALPITKQVIKIVEQMAHDKGVRDLRTYHWKNGEIILDGDLLTGVDPDEIDQDEIDALLEEAEEFIETYDDEHTKTVEEQTEDRSVASIYQRLRRRNDDKNSDQDPNPNDKYQNDEDLNEKIQEIEEDIQKDKEDVKSLNNEEHEETRKTYEENDDLIDQIQDEIKECETQVNDVREFVANLDENENENDESDNNSDKSSDNDNCENDEVNKEDIFSPRKTIHVRVLQAIYGMLEASMLWYKKLRGDMEKHGFIFNSYDGCIANKIVNGKQQTI
ncbi:unnamed protein product [Cylindrotheca closterium]|uniref:Uncharacterized protein n=1 Tax=Cylindrotheca closterium TaxID=2856 RepID=A0AAD2CJ30_9STRA|nr:unnamed protein product [Cylindrotheca closterium]